MRKLALSLAVLTLVASPVLAGKFNKKIEIGQKAPAFSGIPAYAANGETASISLPDIKEDVVVLVFLGNHCPVVVAYEDRIIDLVNSFKGKSVKVVGVSVNDNPDDKLPMIKKRMSEKGYNYIYGFDDSGQIAKDYGATRTPEFFVLDKDRKICYTGALDDNQNEANVKATFLKDAVNALLAGKDVEVSETAPRGCGIQMPRSK